jgi:hypothetical protein
MDFCEASLECHHSSNSPQLSHNAVKARVSKKRNLVMAAEAKIKAKKITQPPPAGRPAQFSVAWSSETRFYLVRLKRPGAVEKPG